MKNLKKILVLAICGCMAFSLFACGEAKTNDATTAANNDTTQTNEKIATIGSIAMEENANKNSNFGSGSVLTTDLGVDKVEFQSFDNINAALLALDSGKVDYLSLPGGTSTYVMKQNDKYTTVPLSTQFANGLGMLLLDKNQELCNQISTAIDKLKADGRLIELFNQYIAIKDIPTGMTFNTYEGANTIKFAVTGDIPPIDYTAQDGTPTGYNLALIKEIADILKINVEIVSIDSSAKVMALTSGKADVVFWTRIKCSDEDINSAKESYIKIHGDVELTLPNGNKIKYSELKFTSKDFSLPEGTIATSSYFKNLQSLLTLK